MECRVFWYNEIRKKFRCSLMDNSQDVKSKLETKYLQITQKNRNNIDSWIKEAIDLQSTFFKKNSDFDEIYFSMLDKYNYYSKSRIQEFLKSILSSFDNYLFTYLKTEDARAESSSIIAPLLFEIKKMVELKFTMV